ncbi:MAG: hypothetical protein IKX23_10830 [Treponema sp.]|nr:hypothetical protein [Treponema sp.]
MNAKYLIIYNPMAGNKTAKKNVYELDKILKDDYLTYIEMTPDFDYEEFIHNANYDESIVVCGGDGTLNSLINSIKKEELSKPIYYYPLGSGNDFIRDIFGKEHQSLIRINDYIRDLPIVAVKGEHKYFLNGIGFGIDGYCCAVGDMLRKNTTKPINYTSIAVKGMLFKYKPTNVKLTVDGEVHVFKNVWLTSTMKGRYYGGGMMATPNQDRKDPEKKVSVYVFMGKNRLKCLMMFAKVFTGEHVKYTNNIITFTGKKILVEFDKERPLQIDGETIPNVLSYSVQA